MAVYLTKAPCKVRLYGTGIRRMARQALNDKLWEDAEFWENEMRQGLKGNAPLVCSTYMHYHH